jgi:hypothetical protein
MSSVKGTSSWKELFQDEAEKTKKVQIVDHKLPQGFFASQPTGSWMTQEESQNPRILQGETPTPIRLPVYPPPNDYQQYNRYYYKPYRVPTDLQEKLKEKIQQHEADHIQASKWVQEGKSSKRYFYPRSCG